MTAEKAHILRPGGRPDNELPPREKIMVRGPSDDEEGVEDGEREGDGAPGEEASGAEVAVTHVRLMPDGTLTPERAWKLAIAWGDGFRGQVAWDMSGGGARSYRFRIQEHEVFRERVRALEAEKTKLEHEGVAGKAVWAAETNLRLARISGVQSEIHRATVLYIETVKALMGEQGGVAASASVAEGEGVAARGPGRPAHQPRALRVDVLQMRDSLLHKGLAPAPA